jgi:transcription termination factor Rho
MSVLDRSALEESPLADLHAIASELSIDGYRRLRRPDLIEAILGRQQDQEPAAGEGHDGDNDAGDLDAAAGVEDEERDEDERAEAPAPKRRRGRRGGRGRGGRDQEAEEADAEEDEARDGSTDVEVARDATNELAEAAPGEAAAPEGPEADEPAEVVERAEEPASAPDEEPIAEGVVELLANGSGFLRVDPPDPSDDDVYVSAAQVKRCELVSGDRVSGPRRAPRRSERFASLIRIDTINGQPAAEVADSARYDELPAAFPDQRFRLGSEDPTVKAIEWLTPFGRGSRVSIVGPARSGKTEALRRVASALAAHEDAKLFVVLAGARPEEIGDWTGPLEPASTTTMAVMADNQGVAVERIVDQGRRLAARGADAVLLIDSLQWLRPEAARRVMASARNIVNGGSLTVVATGPQPVGGETTVIALDATLTATGRFPALDPATSGTLKAELLVGEEGAEEIVRSRAEALGIS